MFTAIEALVGELALVTRRLLAIRVGGAERVTPDSAPGSNFSPALVAFFAPTAPFLASRTQLKVHLCSGRRDIHATSVHAHVRIQGP